MSDKGYNGWTNWETWIINLYFGDDTEWIEEIAKEVDYDIYKLANFIEEYVEDYVRDTQGVLGGIVDEFVRASLQEVDWYDLAESWMPEHEEEEEEEE
jgi:hypothetical protein